MFDTEGRRKTEVTEKRLWMHCARVVAAVWALLSGPLWLALCAPCEMKPLHCLSGIHLQCGQEGGLRNLHLAELSHALLAFLLFLKKLAFAGDVAAVALRRHVLGQRA